MALFVSRHRVILAPSVVASTGGAFLISGGAMGVVPDRFQVALAHTLGHEGGLSDHPNDRGGLTKWGVTQASYSDWRRDRGLPVRSVAQMDRQEMRTIYQERYWNPSSAGAFDLPMACALFDAAVNHGPERAKRLMQEALGALRVDGLIGPATVARVQALGVQQAALMFCSRRWRYFQAIARANPSQRVFLAGWRNRLYRQPPELPEGLVPFIQRMKLKEGKWVLG